MLGSIGATASGRLAANGRLVEYTGGSTGTSLALVCAASGIAITVVTSDAFSIEKRNHMRALGAEVIEIPSDRGRITMDLIDAMMARARALAGLPGGFYADQFNNPIELGVLTGPSACLVFPASREFHVTETPSGKTTTYRWNSANGLALGSQGCRSAFTEHRMLAMTAGQ